jgi:hypothetical protein
LTQLATSGPRETDRVERRPVTPSARRLRRVGLALLIACAIPFAIFYTTVLVAGVWVAIFAALGWAYGAIAWRRQTARRPSGLLLLTATVMTGAP